MNATTVLKAVNEIESYNISVQVMEILNRLKAEAEKDIRATAAKQSGNGSRQKAAERVIKNCKKMHVASIALHGAWMENGKQYFTDAYQAFKLSAALPLEELPENIEKINLHRIFDGAKNNFGAVLDLPTVADLKAYIKIEKAKKPRIILWDFGENLPAVNAEYLLNVLEILPGCTATAGREKTLISPLYFISEQGEAILLPVRKAARI